ncbi:MAG: hypothetical protein HY951_01095 [Bacteroidia bacterium]|nr:hypothetical protein [Bacteroidia bacterium]
MKYNIVFVVLIFVLNVFETYAQCCGGGGGSPIAGGSSQGVLSENQMEVNSNFQLISTTKFLTGDKPDTNFLDSYDSKYIYTRLAFGLSKKLTISLETGYWINKTQVGLHKVDTNSSSGIGDLIIFPRYDILKITKNSKTTELTVGLGFKVPLGSYNDSIKKIEPFSGEPYYIPKTLAVQTSSGAQDLIFYLFLFRGNSIKKLNFFTNATYIKKGWNPLGEKIGDYASIGLFASKTLFKKLTVTIQLKGEWVDQMKLNNNILMYAYPNYNPDATGFRKVFFVPQISYNYKGKLTFYLMSEHPLYQYMFNTQISSQHQFTFGITYRFYPDKSKCEENVEK